MVEAAMQEGIQKHIVISDAEPEIVRKMICFMYTGCCKCHGLDLVPLMGIADKYDVQELCTLCAARLVETIDEHNVVPAVRQLRLFAARKDFQPYLSKLKKQVH